jgi:tetratricopeptide (TPR) repeat protein
MKKNPRYLWAAVFAIVGVALAVGAFVGLRLVERDRLLKEMTLAAFMYIEEGRLEEAELCLAEAPRISDDWRLPQIQVELAEAYFKEGNMAKAGEIVQEVLTTSRIESNHRLGLLHADLLMEKGSYDEAIESLEKVNSDAVSTCGTCTYGVLSKKYMKMAECYEKLGKHKDAYLSYLEFYDFGSLGGGWPGMFEAEPMEKLRQKLSDSEKQELDMIAVDKLVAFLEWQRKEKIETVLNGLDETGGELPDWYVACLEAAVGKLPESEEEVTPAKEE